MSYNLTDNVSDDFIFSISGTEYKMKYPLVRDIENLQELAKPVEGETAEEKTERTEKANDFIYKYISPVSDKDVSIEEIMKTQNLKVMQNFNKMVQTEFGIE
jgi:hypothetical protein